MPSPRLSSASRAALCFLLVGVLWFLVADLAAARLFAPGARETVDAAARWGFTLVGAGLLYLFARERERRLGEVASRLGGTRELLHQAVRNMYDALFVVDVEERSIVSCNPAAEEMFGYDRDTMIGGSTRLLHVDDGHWRRFAEESDPVVAQGDTWRGEFEMRRADGTTIRTEHAVSLIEDLEGREGRVLAVSVVRDVSDRRELEAELRRREKRHRAILANISDVVTVVDEDARILYANATIRSALGWEPEEVLGRRGFELVHPEDRDWVEEAFGDTLRTGEGTARYRFRRGDGGWSRVESRGVVTEDEALEGTVVVTRVLEAVPGKADAEPGSS